MQPVIGRIEQLTTTPSPPTGGSGVPSMLNKLIHSLDEAQAKADKLKATLLEAQELVANLNSPAELLTDLKNADAKKQILDEITNAVHSSLERSAKSRFSL